MSICAGCGLDMDQRHAEGAFYTLFDRKSSSLFCRKCLIQIIERNDEEMWKNRKIYIEPGDEHIDALRFWMEEWTRKGVKR